jgi:DNA-directed RNA polymerase specialized sigma24 family protein
LSERDNPRGLDSLRLLSNEELARAAAGGDEAAARVLLERFEEPLYRYTVALVRDPDLAREATWSALFEAARAVRAGEHSEPIAPWIFRVAHTAADVAFGRPEGAGGLDEAAARVAAAGDEDRDRLERLLIGLDSVPDRDRSSLLLRELVGLEYTGIATVTGARAAAARQSVYRARRALLGDEQPPTPHCAEIQAAMSKAEEGLRERRSIALHLETCPYCEEFAAQLEQRPKDLRTLFPAPAEPLAAELVPPLPPLPPPSARPARRRGAAAGDRRRRALVPVMLGLLLVGAAIATAVALNDNGGGDHGRANAAGSGQRAQRPATGGGGARAKPKPAKPKPAKPAKPHVGAKGKSKPGRGANGKGAKAGAGAGGSNGGTGGGANGGTPSGGNKGGGATGGASTGGGSGGGGTGTGGANAKRRAHCRQDPAAAPAQSAYGSRAGVAQAEIDPCARGERASGGLASTGLDAALVLMAGGLLLALGVSLRRLGSAA